MLLRCDDHDRVAGAQRGSQSPHEPEQARRLWSHDPYYSGRLGRRDVEVGTCDLVEPTEGLGELVCPSRVPNPCVGRLIDLPLPITLLSSPHFSYEIVSARLHHLGDSVEDLTTVVAAGSGPFGP